MLGEEQLALVAAELATDGVAGEELLLQPYRHRGQERAQAARRHAEIVLEDALELEQRLVVEAHVVEVFEPRSGLTQAVGDGVARKPVVVLLAREALLLRRSNDLAVAYEARRRVVVVGRDAEDRRHRPCSPRLSLALKDGSNPFRDQFGPSCPAVITRTAHLSPLAHNASVVTLLENCGRSNYRYCLADACPLIAPSHQS